MSFTNKGKSFTQGGGVSSTTIAIFLCLASFYVGLLFTYSMWIHPQNKLLADKIGKLRLEHGNYNSKNILNKTPQNGSLIYPDKKKCFMIIGINTAFGNEKQRDLIRNTWMPQGEKRKRMEEEKGIIIRFVLGQSDNDILTKLIDEEDELYRDFLRLDHKEGYNVLTTKTKNYFVTAVSLWDAEYYIKVDDDVHINLATLYMTLAKYRNKPRVYVGNMKSDPVLTNKDSRWFEPEHWKFGINGNNYFQHASGQLYAISKELATYIFVNKNVLHTYANEDVSLGSWLIGLDVEHVDIRQLSCNSHDCEPRTKDGHLCISTFDWECNGVCGSPVNIQLIHRRCSEPQDLLWNLSYFGLVNQI